MVLIHATNVCVFTVLLFCLILLLQLTYYLDPVTHPQDTEKHQYPVLVWFHSGDFLSGSAQTEPGHVLATRGIVVVTFNYRLGALGTFVEFACMYSYVVYTAILV